MGRVSHFSTFKLYFKSLSSTDSQVTPSPTNTKVLGPQLAATSFEPLGWLEVLRVLCDKESNTFEWCPVLEKGNGPLWVFSPLQEDLVKEERQYMVSNWSLVLITRDVTTGVKQSPRYNPLTPKYYHPNIVAKQFILGKQIPLLYESIVRLSKRNQLYVTTLNMITRGQDNKFSIFVWGNYRRDQLLPQLVVNHQRVYLL